MGTEAELGGGDFGYGHDRMDDTLSGDVGLSYKKIRNSARNAEQAQRPTIYYSGRKINELGLEKNSSWERGLRVGDPYPPFLKPSPPTS